MSTVVLSAVTATCGAVRSTMIESAVGDAVDGEVLIAVEVGSAVREYGAPLSIFTAMLGPVRSIVVDERCLSMASEHELVSVDPTPPIQCGTAGRRWTPAT